MMSLKRASGSVVLAAALATAALGHAGRAQAQSLDIHRPAPLVAGENTGTVDSMVGPQFWSFHSLKGAATITIRFTSMTLMGNASTASIQAELHDASGRVFASQTITSNGKSAEVRWPGKFGAPGTVIVEVRPPTGSLVRTGGDYSISVTGAVSYAGVHAAGPERIAGTYSLMTCPPTLDCQAVRFFPNGSVKAADGTSGTWTSFDPAALIYTVHVGQAQWSVKLVPGRGLVSASDTNVVVFQAVR